MAAATAGATAGAGAGCRMVIDLRVTKDSPHDPPDLTMQLPGVLPPQVHVTKEWSLSRNQVPYSLAKKGITLHVWNNVFDKVDALWERRTAELCEVPVGTVSPRFTLANAATYTATTLFYIFLLYWINRLNVLIHDESWDKVVGWLILLCVGSFFLPIVVILVADQTRGNVRNFHSPKCFGTLALFEGDWSRLADEQRCVFQSFDVDVVPIKEVTTTKLRYHVWTVGLRFSFDMPSTNSSNADDCLLMLSNGPTPDAAIQDLDRLLHLNQTGDVQTEEYRRLKSCILSKMALPKNCGARPVGTTAVMPGVEADTETCDETQVYIEIV